MASSCLLCVLCSAGWDVHAALSKLTRIDDFVNEQNIKDYDSLRLGVKLTSSSDFEVERLQVFVMQGMCVILKAIDKLECARQHSVLYH